LKFWKCHKSKKGTSGRSNPLRMAHFNELPRGGAGVVPKLASTFENSYNVTLVPFIVFPLPPFIFLR
jgi:hypothetical protein